jgi:hypothetical protein
MVNATVWYSLSLVAHTIANERLAIVMTLECLTIYRDEPQSLKSLCHLIRGISSADAGNKWKSQHLAEVMQ